MSNLAVNILGIDFENPFILSASPATAEIENIKKAFEIGWAGAVLKTISAGDIDISEVSPRFSAIHDDRRNVLGFENIELISRHDLKYWKEGIVELKRCYPKKVVIASIMASAEKEAWQSLVRSLQETPIDAFELNFSCPHGVTERGVGMAIGTDPEISAAITGWVKEVANVPVFVKLSANVTNIAAIAEAVKGAGADGLSAINTVSCLMGVDIDTLTPLPDVAGESTYGGYSGLAIKPIGLKCVAQVYNATGLPVLAVGGITNWKDTVEYIAMGGKAVELCTEVMISGYSIVRLLISGLEQYMDIHGFKSLADFHGVAAKKLTTHGALSRTERSVAVIDAARCRVCKKCAGICAESGYNAILSNGSFISIQEPICDGCGLCACACPYNAIRMKLK